MNHHTKFEINRTILNKRPDASILDVRMTIFTEAKNSLKSLRIKNLQPIPDIFTSLTIINDPYRILGDKTVKNVRIDPQTI